MAAVAVAVAAPIRTDALRLGAGTAALAVATAASTVTLPEMSCVGTAALA